MDAGSRGICVFDLQEFLASIVINVSSQQVEVVLVLVSQEEISIELTVGIWPRLCGHWNSSIRLFWNQSLTLVNYV